MEKEIERLIDNYGNDVLRIGYIYLKDKSLAEDIFQDVFVKVYKNFNKFKGKSSEKTWIITITINTCKDMLRSSWLKRIISIEDSYGSEISAVTDDNLENTVIEKIEYEGLTDKVMKLPNKYKEIILLYYYEELSTSEISKILKIPEGTVRSRLYNARKLLKFNIDGKNENEQISK